MIALSTEEMALATLLPLVMATTEIVRYAHRRCSAHIKARCIRRIARLVIAGEDPSDNDIRALRLRYTTSTITESASFVAEHIYGDAYHRVTLLLEMCKIENGKCWGALREVVNTIVGYPNCAIRYLARLSTPLSWYEVAVISQLLRRASIPIAYTPLLTSRSRNLQLVGIYICDALSITDAEPHLQHLCGEEESEVATNALYALCTIRGDITTPQARSAMARLSTHQRTSLLRHMVWACYSLRSSAQLLNREERIRFAQRVNTYKCKIVCN